MISSWGPLGTRKLTLLSVTGRDASLCEDRGTDAVTLSFLSENQTSSARVGLIAYTELLSFNKKVVRCLWVWYA
jgi:hypothetical protein